MKVTVNSPDDNRERDDKRDRVPVTGLPWNETITETMTAEKTASFKKFIFKLFFLL